MSGTPEWLDDKGKIIEHRYCQGSESQRPNGMGAAYEQYPHQSRGNHPRGAYLCMNMTECILTLETCMTLE